MKGSKEDVFDRQKKQTLGGIDQSKKGSFDVAIHDLMVYLNNLDDYFTTSSCSGRIIVFSEGEKKKGCKWLLTSHDTVEPQRVVETLKTQQQSQQSQRDMTQCVEKMNIEHDEGIDTEPIGGGQGDINNSSETIFDKMERPESEEMITFKYESFILHVQCRTMESAQDLLKVSLGCGYRNSGIVAGKKKKFMVAVRSSHGLEVPLLFNPSVTVSDQYVTQLVHMANKKLQENFVKVDKFFGEVKKCFPN